MKIAVGIFVTTLLYVTVTEVSGTPYMHRMRKSEDALQGGQIDQLLAANNVSVNLCNDYNNNDGYMSI